jgi:lipoprotein NlpI
MPMNNKIFPFLAGAAVAALIAITFFVIRHWGQSPDDKVHLWGKYWESRMGFEYAMWAEIESHNLDHHQDTNRLAEENDRCFKELLDRNILVPVYFSSGEIYEFDKVLSNFPHYRHGYSLEGGQWPVGIEYIDDLSAAAFPKMKFLKENRMVQHNDWDGAILDSNKAIDIDPKNPAGYLSRADAKWGKGDLIGAIADYTNAIDVSPKNAFAYNCRASAKHAKGDLVGAIADFSQAIALDPKYADAYSRRGSAKGGMGDYVGAIADYTSAIEIFPKEHAAYGSRGYFRYDTQKFTDALSDFRKVTELDPSNSEASEYSRFRIWLIRSRQGDERDATQELLAYLANRISRGPGDWHLSVIRYLVGQLSEPDFFASAICDGPNKVSEHMCEAYFYSGSKHLFAGEDQMAIDLFKKCITTDIRHFTEYVSAVAELKTLEAPKK